jgi:hypothetical protein
MRPYGEEESRDPGLRWLRIQGLVKSYFGRWRDRESRTSYLNARRTPKKRARRAAKEEIEAEMLSPGRDMTKEK